VRNTQPLIAAVHGAAVGAGLGLALALLRDFRIATNETRFAANFVKLALHPGFGITLTLPRLVGAQKAALMLLTGWWIGGVEALGWGLVDKLASADQLRVTARRFAAELAEVGPLAVIATRTTLRRNLTAELRQQLILELREQRALQDAEDFSEGIRAVAKRRPGKFAGK
jgi:enoyl-CoA hydratase/carnithine racemase